VRYPLVFAGADEVAFLPHRGDGALVRVAWKPKRRRAMARSHAPAWECTCGRSSGQGFMTLERQDLLPCRSVEARWEKSQGRAFSKCPWM